MNWALRRIKRFASVAENQWNMARQLTTHYKRLKATLWSKIGPIVDRETASKLTDVNTSPQFIGALTEMVWNQLESASRDLESFAGYVPDLT